MTVQDYNDNPSLLLNATQEELHGALYADGKIDDVEDLQTLEEIGETLKCILKLYQVNLGLLDVEAVDEDCLDKLRDASVRTVRQTIVSVTRDGRTWGFQGKDNTFPPPGVKTDAWWALTPAITALIRGVSNAYECEVCGRIGTYTSKRRRQFCSDRCRFILMRRKKELDKRN